MDDRIGWRNRRAGDGVPLPDAGNLMTIRLRQSTASQEIPLGYFVDSTDGNTEETGLTIANTDIKLWKMGATALANKNSGGGTHISNGIYYAVLDATDTNTLGALIVFVHVSGALPVRVECEVLTAVNYDALIAGTDLLDVSTTQFNGTAVTATAGRPEVNTTHAAGTAWGSGAITAASIASSAIADTKIATGALTAAKFAAGAIDAAALAADAGTEIGTAVWATTTRVLTAGTNIALAKGVGVTGFNDLDAAGVRSAVGLATANLDTQLVTIDDLLDTEIAAIKSDTAAILIDTAEIGAAGAGLTALASAANLATANAALVTIDGIVDDILVDTAVIGAAGAGLTAVPWNAAWDAEVESECADALAAYDPPTNAELTARTLATADYATAANLATVAGYLDTEIAAILADTNELQTDWANGGRLDLLLDSASSAGDPWSTPIPGAYGAGTAGNIIGNNLDAAVSTRASQASVNTIDDFLDTEIAAIKTKTDFLPSATAGANGGLPTVNASNQIAGIAGTITTLDALDTAQDSQHATTQGLVTTVDTVVDAILVDTAEIGAAGAGLTALATQASVTAIDDLVDTEVAAIKTVVDAIEVDTQNIQSRLPTSLVSGRIDASVGAMAANVMTAAAAAADLTTELQSGLATAASLATVAGYIDTEIGTLLAASTAIEADTQDIQSRLPAALVSGRIDASVGAMAANVMTASALAADAGAEIADAVWDEAIAGHAGAGSTGAALSAAGAAGDPWSTSLPGAYGAGTAGNILGNNLDAAVSTRASQTSVTTIDDLLDTEVAAIKSVVDSILVDTAEIGVAGAGLTALATQASVTAVDDLIDTEIAAIKAVVDDILVDTAVIGAAGAGLTGIPWNAAWDAEVQSEVADAIVAAGAISADVQYVNGIEVIGSGTALDPWNPAP